MATLKRADKPVSEVYIDALFELVKEMPQIVLVETDLGMSIPSTRFRDTMPDNFVECGIAEVNAVNVAAGLSANGLLPIVHSLSPFITRRAYDASVLSVSYSGLNCKLVGDGYGLYAELNGGTHAATEDMGIMRNIPRFKVVEATDNEALSQLLPQIMRDPDPVYLRIPRARANPYVIYNEGDTVTLGKANVLREGKDATIIANSLMVAFSLEAAGMLEQEGLQVGVIDMHTLKPIDREAVICAAQSGGPMITAENHSVINGLGSAVAEVIAEEGLGVKLTRFGYQDRFSVVGSHESFIEELKMRPCDIADAVRKACK